MLLSLPTRLLITAYRILAPSEAAAYDSCVLSGFMIQERTPPFHASRGGIIATRQRGNLSVANDGLMLYSSCVCNLAPSPTLVKTNMFLEFALSSANISVRSGMGGRSLAICVEPHRALSGALGSSGAAHEHPGPVGAKHAVFCFNIDRGSTEHPFE